jgi:hypothetical protein
MPDRAFGPDVLVAFLRRSFFAVDGLWFVKVEEESDFDEALELDRRVWEVMAKIQARQARELLDVRGNTPAELARCLELKFAAEDHDFEVSPGDGGVVEVTIRECSWLAIMEQSGRGHLAERVAKAICGPELDVWAREFGGYGHALDQRICSGHGVCRHVFSVSSDGRE